jgi:hypothetical protein
MIKKGKSKTNNLLIVLLVWFAVSAIYIVQDLWRNGISATYQAGYQKALADVIVSSEACQPFDVFVGDSRTQLISVPCLQAAQQQAQQQQQAPAAQGQQGLAPANLEGLIN